MGNERPSLTVFVADWNHDRRAAIFKSLPEQLTKIACDTVTQVFERLERTEPAAVVLAPSPLERASVLDAASRIRLANQNVKIILIVGNSSEDFAIGALRAGVNEYLREPVISEDVVAAVVRFLPDTTWNDCECDEIVGDSADMRSIRHLIDRLAPSDATVLITGETGTGKELVARRIHRLSRRSNGPLVSVNCAAIPISLVESELFGFEKGAFTGAGTRQDGKLTQADKGTLFLDEIGDMKLAAQAKILRVIEDRQVQPLGSRAAKPVDIRFVAATNHNLEELAAQDRFRHDLFFRLNVVRINIPPLRERSEDIPLLATHLIREFRSQYGRPVADLAPSAHAYLMEQEWRGNVRELRNAIESALLFSTSERITDNDFFHMRHSLACGPPLCKMTSSAVAESQPLEAFRKLSEMERLVKALEATSWNKSKAAEMLNWSRMTVYRKIEKYELCGDACNPV